MLPKTRFNKCTKNSTGSSGGATNFRREGMGGGASRTKPILGGGIMGQIRGKLYDDRTFRKPAGICSSTTLSQEAIKLIALSITVMRCHQSR